MFWILGNSVLFLFFCCCCFLCFFIRFHSSRKATLLEGQDTRQHRRSDGIQQRKREREREREREYVCKWETVSKSDSVGFTLHHVSSCHLQSFHFWLTSGLNYQSFIFYNKFQHWSNQACLEISVIWVADQAVYLLNFCRVSILWGCARPAVTATCVSACTHTHTQTHTQPFQI